VSRTVLALERAGEVRPERFDEELLEASRSRLPAPPEARDLWSSVAIGGAFLAVALAMAVFISWPDQASLPTIAAAVLAYAFASRIEFEIGTGSAVPTQMLFVPMLFAVPAPLVPLCVAGGYLVGATVDYFVTRRAHPLRAFVLLSCSWYSVGPSLVFVLGGASEPSWGDWPLYIAALVSQFGFDLMSSAAREWFAFRNPVKQLLPYFGWVYAVDALLTPVGYLAAMASVGMPLAFLLTIPLVGLLALLARDRQARIDKALELDRAYRGAQLQARWDPLTGLGNRLAWEEALQQAQLRWETSREPASVIMLDMDGLKEANDTRGHDFGDELLRVFAALVHANVRNSDIVARIGGDEFGVLIRGSDHDLCKDTAARLSAVIGAHPGIDEFEISAALGYASCPPADTVAAAMREADGWMYERKPGGRSREHRAV
jgi:diguanylate cyclase (GGDEF)-like protein